MNRDRIRARLAELAVEHLVPGIQFAVHHGDTDWSCEVGPGLDHSTAVPTGSVTKLLTASAVMTLVADGDLDLHEPLGEQVDRVTGAAAVTTPFELLSHTGGLPSDPAEVRATTLSRHIEHICAELEPLAEPGVAFSYSNLGYVLLGHALEQLTGMDWAEAVAAIVLAPLGLPTRMVVGPAATDGIASGHAVHPGRGTVRPVAQSLSPVDAPAGAWAASATDLLVLGHALTGHADSALDPASVKEMHTPVTAAEPFGLASAWGLGLAHYDHGPATIGHDGNGDGTSCHLRVNPDTGTVVALTATAGTGFALWRALAADLPELGLPVGDHDPLPDLGPVAAAAPAVEGVYANGDTAYAVRRATEPDGPHLSLTVDDEPFADLTVHGDLRFSMRDHDSGETDQVGRFLTDDGEPRWLQVGGRLARRVA